MWEMRAACIILADVVVVSDICIESGRQGEGGRMCRSCANTKQTQITTHKTNRCFFNCL